MPPHNHGRGAIPNGLGSKLPQVEAGPIGAMFVAADPLYPCGVPGVPPITSGAIGEGGGATIATVGNDALGAAGCAPPRGASDGTNIVDVTGGRT